MPPASLSWGEAGGVHARLPLQRGAAGERRPPTASHGAWGGHAADPAVAGEVRAGHLEVPGDAGWGDGGRQAALVDDGVVPTAEQGPVAQVGGSAVEPVVT